MRHIRRPACLSDDRTPCRNDRVPYKAANGKVQTANCKRHNVWRVAGVGPSAATETPGLRRSPSSPSHPTGGHAGRIGAALAEVLIALLIMGIGVVSAATMFPIAVLRTVQATQLTRATVLRYNAETLLDLHPELIDNTRIPIVLGGTATAVVDPLGYHLIGTVDPTFQTVFGGTAGDVRGNPIVDPLGAPAQLRRVAMSTIPALNTSAEAESFVTLPDSWTEQANDVVTAASPTSVTLSSNIPTGIPTAGGESRITLFHSSGRKSLIRTITTISGNTVNWTAALPAEYTPPATKIERAVIETRNRQFTWMLTVRKNDSGVANINVVVFFNRAHEPSDEAVFPTIPANTLNSRFQIDIPPNVTRPILRRGGYLFDPVNARWYRITKVENEQTNTPTITIDRTPTEKIRYGVFLPRVVDVFPINTRVVP